MRIRVENILDLIKLTDESFPQRRPAKNNEIPML